MIQMTKRTIHVSLIAGALALSACGGGSNGGNTATTNVNDVGVNTAPSSDELSRLLAQGPINDEAIDLNDTANRQTDDTRDAFDL